MPQAAKPMSGYADEPCSDEGSADARPQPVTAAGPWHATGAAGTPNAPLSPALLMQQRLAERIGDDDVSRWPWRVTVSFVLISCSAFWVALYALLRVIVA